MEAVFKSRQRSAVPLPADERQRRREAAHGEGRVAVSGLELLDGAAVGGDKQEVGIPQFAANGAAGGVDGRSGRPLSLEGSAFRILGQDGNGPEDLDSGALPTVSGFSVDSDTIAAASCCRFAGVRCRQQGRGVSSRVSRVAYW